MKRKMNITYQVSPNRSYYPSYLYGSGSFHSAVLAQVCARHYQSAPPIVPPCKSAPPPCTSLPVSPTSMHIALFPKGASKGGGGGGGASLILQ